VARKPSPEKEEAKRLYLDSGGEMPLVDIARHVGKSDGLIRKWKSDGKWEDELNGNVTKSKGNVTIQKSNVTKSSVPEKSAPAPPIKTKRPPSSNEVSVLEMPALTLKQELFVQEFLVDLNATQAAIRAGYKAKNARVVAAQNLSKLNIRRAVRKAMLDRIQRTHVSQDWVVQRLVRLADYDLRDFANLATVKRIFETRGGDVMEDEIQTVVLNSEFDGSIAKSLFQDKDGIKLEMPDRLRALELLGKHIGMFSDPHRQRMDKARLELDRERAEIEKTKANKDALGNDLVIKVKLPEVNPDGDD
jgi:phage terminase small subunit